MKTTADYLRDALDLLGSCDENAKGRCDVHDSTWAEGENHCEWYIDALAQSAGARWKRLAPVPCDHTLGPCPGCIERGARQELERITAGLLNAGYFWHRPFDVPDKDGFRTYSCKQVDRLLADPTEEE